MTRFEPLSNIFDALHQFWEHPRNEKRIASLLITIFFIGIIGIELKRQGLLPAPLASVTPSNHFYAVNLAFSLLLVLEVMSLIFVLSTSVTRSIGKQFEILTLILLRNSFKELANMHEPINVLQDWEALLHILSSSVAALCIFVFLGLFYRFHTHQGYLRDPQEKLSYIMCKKILGLVLFCTFVAVGSYQAWDFLVNGVRHDFFQNFYTILIFADILLVLIAQRYMPSFHAVFRNSGFVVATLFIRIALSAPPYYDAAAGLVAALFTLGVATATSVFRHGALCPVDYRHMPQEGATEGSAQCASPAEQNAIDNATLAAEVSQESK